MHLRARIQSAVEHLPRGKTLPADVFERRHRGMVLLLWAHVPSLFVFAIAMGNSAGHGLFEITGITLAALAARSPRLSRRARGTIVAIGLLTCSAVLVHLWHGAIEGHFHFFVMVTLLSLYEEWFPYLIAFVYVLVHHTVAGLVDPHSVFNHHAAQVHPCSGPASTRCSSARWGSSTA